MEDAPNKSEKSSNNPEEQLREENELLKLKLRAETGAELSQFDQIEPEIENDFLKNVIEFERQYAQAKKTTIYELLGKPQFVKSDQLNDDQIPAALEQVDSILQEKNIGMDYGAEYPEREKYRFITEELFMHEVDDINVPGMTLHFIYEEFHPNHPLTITNRAKEFIEAWFRREFSEYSWELANQWITDQGEIYNKEKILIKFQQIFDCYERFENAEYELQKVHADVEDGADTGLGFAEGTVKYDAISENGEIVHFEGPFKLYLQVNDDWWTIFFAYWPGLKW